MSLPFLVAGVFADFDMISLKAKKLPLQFSIKISLWCSCCSNSSLCLSLAQICSSFWCSCCFNSAFSLPCLWLGQSLHQSKSSIYHHFIENPSGPGDLPICKHLTTSKTCWHVAYTISHMRPRGLADIPLASHVTHTGSTFAFRKRWGQIDWRSLGEHKT